MIMDRVQLRPQAQDISPPFGERNSLPPPVDAVFATAVLSVTRMLAAFYWGRSAHGAGVPLILLDFEVAPQVAGSWPGVAERLAALHSDRRARTPAPLGVFVESEILVPHVLAAGAVPHLVPAHLSSADGWHVLCQSASGQLAQDQVGYTAAAQAAMQVRPFLSAAGVMAGPRTDDPTVAAFLYGVVLALDEAAARDPKRRAPKPSARN